MTFSLFKAHLPFHNVFKFLQILSPQSSETPEDWSERETEKIKVGDIVLILEPLYSQFGNPKQGIGVSEGDKFKINQVLLSFGLDAGYPMCISMTGNSYEMQFAETVLCVKADLAKQAKQGFYYLIARPKKQLAADVLEKIAEMHKYSNNGDRSECPKDLPEPAYYFFSSMNIPLEPVYAKQPMDLEILGFYLFGEVDFAPAGKAPDLREHYEPVPKSNEKVPEPAEDLKAITSLGLNALLSDDWTPDRMPVVAPTPAKQKEEDSPRAVAEEIANLVGGLKDIADQSSAAKHPSPGLPPAAPPAVKPLNQAQSAKEAEPVSQAKENAISPPGPVPLHGSAKEHTDTPDKAVTLESLLVGDLNSEAATERPKAMTIESVPEVSQAGKANSLADGLMDLAKSTTNTGPIANFYTSGSPVTAPATVPSSSPFETYSEEPFATPLQPSIVAPEEGLNPVVEAAKVDDPFGLTSLSTESKATVDAVQAQPVDSLSQNDPFGLASALTQAQSGTEITTPQTQGDPFAFTQTPPPPPATPEPAPQPEVASDPFAFTQTPPPPPATPEPAPQPEVASDPFAFTQTPPATPATPEPAPQPEVASDPFAFTQTPPPPPATPEPAPQPEVASDPFAFTQTPPPPPATPEPAPQPEVASDPFAFTQTPPPPPATPEPAPQPEVASDPFAFTQTPPPPPATPEPAPQPEVASDLSASTQTPPPPPATTPEPAPQPEVASDLSASTQTPPPPPATTPEPAPVSEPASPPAPAQQPLTPLQATTEALAPVSVTPSTSPPPSQILPSQPAPAGVGGLIAKLEQQAQRATLRLEEKMHEVEGRLQKDSHLNVGKLNVKEQSCLQNVASLRNVLSRRLNSAGDEIKASIKDSAESGSQKIKDSSASSSGEISQLASSLSQDVLQAFEELGKSTEGLAHDYTFKASSQQQVGAGEVKSLVLNLQSKLEEISKQHSHLMQRSFEQFEKRAMESNQHCNVDLNSTYERLIAELLSLKEDCIDRLNTLSTELTDTIDERASLLGLNLRMHADLIGTSVLIPRLMSYRQAISASAQKLREKYKEEVEKSATLKLAEVRPVLMSSREKIEAVVKEAQTLKSNVESGQREEFEKMYAALAQFMDEKLAESKNLADANLGELHKIEQEVSALSDAARIETDPELASARTKVLSRLQDIGTQLQDGVNDALRRQIAGMEDKGRMLQEELISSMEGEAFAVRKSTEASLTKAKQALEQAFKKISELQNQYLQ